MWRTQGEHKKTTGKHRRHTHTQRKRKNNRKTKKQYANAIVQHTFWGRAEGEGEGAGEAASGAGGECANELAAATNVADNYACKFGRGKVVHKQLELEKRVCQKQYISPFPPTLN